MRDLFAYSLISFSAFSTESEPWQMLRPTASAKSPRIVPTHTRISIHMRHHKHERHVPGADARGLVAPSMTRPVLTASRPSQTIATTGPEAMYLIRPGKKPLPLRSS